MVTVYLCKKKQSVTTVGDKHFKREIGFVVDNVNYSYDERFPTSKVQTKILPWSSNPNIYNITINYLNHFHNFIKDILSNKKSSGFFLLYGIILRELSWIKVEFAAEPEEKNWTKSLCLVKIIFSNLLIQSQNNHVLIGLIGIQRLYQKMKLFSWKNILFFGEIELEGTHIWSPEKLWRT